MWPFVSHFRTDEGKGPNDQLEEERRMNRDNTELEVLDPERSEKANVGTPGIWWGSRVRGAIGTAVCVGSPSVVSSLSEGKNLTCETPHTMNPVPETPNV